jgi:uncharacterized protein
MNTPNIGTKSTCQACKKEIEYIGPYWRHTGAWQPRHIALPNQDDNGPKHPRRAAILFHSYGDGKHCPDGFAAAYAAWKHFGDEAAYIPCVHQQEPPCLDEFDEVYFVDFCYPYDVMKEITKNVEFVCVLDHHKSAMEQCRRVLNFGKTGMLRFAENKSGAELTWEHFFPTKPVLPLIRYVSDRDLWKKQLPFTEEVHRALSSFPQDFVVYDTLAQLPDYVEFMRRVGEPLYQKHLEDVSKLAKSCRTKLLADFIILCTSTGNSSLVSDTLNLLCRRNPDVAFAANYHQAHVGAKVKFELRSVGDFDVSFIAALFGGGGHKNAAGFEVDANDERLKGFWG